MKNHKYIYIILVIISFLGCEENFSPKADFKEDYALYCMLRGDTTYQIATLSRSYQVEGFDPEDNSVNPAVRGAKIKLFIDDNIYEFRDTVVANDSSARYDSSYYYYLDNLVIDTKKEIKIEAALPGGDTLKAETVSTFIRGIYAYPNVSVLPAGETTDYYFQWTDYESDRTLIYLPRFIFTYYNNEIGMESLKSLEIPVKYVKQRDTERPVYPEATTYNIIMYSGTGLFQRLNEVFGDSLSRRKYVITGAEFSILIMDENLGTYISSVQTFLDGFTIRVNAPEFSNIEGGLGVFGSYQIKTLNVQLNYIILRQHGFIVRE